MQSHFLDWFHNGSPVFWILKELLYYICYYFREINLLLFNFLEYGSKFNWKGITKCQIGVLNGMSMSKSWWWSKLSKVSTFLCVEFKIFVSDILKVLFYFFHVKIHDVVWPNNWPSWLATFWNSTSPVKKDHTIFIEFQYLTKHTLCFLMLTTQLSHASH